MKYLLLALALFSLPAQAVEVDKFAHAGISYAMTNILLESGYTKAQAFAGSMLIGLIKEANDHQSNHEHLRDLTADAIGTVGAMIVFRYDIRPKQRAW